mmetsp:Transcript_11227/g.38291  ORF Transcript_11227/g.38291 Transcript_11227/m.38291 type:complete len:101 (-) Transcript_11227:7279-7581(-)
MEFYMYETQGHGFMNGTAWGKEMQKKLGRPEVEDATILLAMDRMKDFLAKHVLVRDREGGRKEEGREGGREGGRKGEGSELLTSCEGLSRRIRIKECCLR